MWLHVYPEEGKSNLLEAEAILEGLKAIKQETRFQYAFSGWSCFLEVINGVDSSLSNIQIFLDNIWIFLEDIIFVVKSLNALRFYHSLIWKNHFPDNILPILFFANVLNCSKMKSTSQPKVKTQSKQKTQPNDLQEGRTKSKK